MKTICKILLLLVIMYTLNQSHILAQNLVPNPGFEIFDTCVTNLNQISSAVGWNSDRPSPDYFNACDLTYPSVKVPLNAFGFQYPSSGNGYAGLLGKNASLEMRE